MNEINVLDKSVFNRIAAGEVVDRPSSIVKELIENSIDAGATSISISIVNGGIDLIKVVDNGKGIAFSDVKNAFLPHATSKIKDISDLDAISTLGFRGEALPSIASVAKVTMVTRKANSDFACRYVIDNGVEYDFGEMGAPFGTSVSVENLFERIPARRKFLAKESVEENAITTLVSKYILANYNISFEYSVNGKLIYNSSGNSVEDSIKTVYDGSFLSNMAKIHSTMSDITLSGYINKPSFSKHSKSFQTLIVNGRYVINDELSYVIFGCYQKYLMKRQFPAYVLYLNIPYDLVDVNVHPSKMQIRFAIPSLVKKIIVDTIRDQILNEVEIPKDIGGFISQVETKEDDNFNKSNDSFALETSYFNLAPSNKIESAITTSANKPAKIDSSLLGDIDAPTAKIKSSFTGWTNTSLKESKEDSFVDIFTDLPSNQTTFSIPETVKIIGKLFNTYILIEKGDSLFIVDQHAAHEKLLYDKFVTEFENGRVSVQKMLIPYDFSVTPSESDILVDNMSTLKDIGFELISKNNGKFSLLTTPACCVGLNVKTFISDFLSLKTGSKYDMMPDAFRSKLMQTACKSATKGHDDLQESEIVKLLEQMTNEMKELFCPHGRPVVVKLSKSDVEKWFKRIV